MSCTSGAALKDGKKRGILWQKEVTPDENTGSMATCHLFVYEFCFFDRLLANTPITQGPLNQGTGFLKQFVRLILQL